MAYVALARKWRPRQFADVIGQEHVRRALTHALDTDRVHHAFLFTGTRGVGKTTIARILAKCLNCERGVSATPCGECASCREIDAGRFVDLIEVDAASRTKVDDTRELLDNVQYAPTRGRCKVYLIDEVHMLSVHSFNALLKTLEEPPPRVKFLLATTDPHKLPATVLSRCLQFNLKRLPVQQIAERLRHILQAEGIEHDAAGVRLLAQAADGSVRDGLSLLDQVIAFGGGRAGEPEVRAMLGTVARDHVVKLARLFSAPDAAAVLECARELEQWAPDHAQLLEEFAALLVRVALAQAVPGFEGDDLYEPELLAALAAALAPEDVQLYYQCAILGRRDLHLAPDPASGFEMTLLRMLAFRPQGAAPARAPAGGGGAAAAAVPAAVPARPGAPAREAREPETAAQAPAAVPPVRAGAGAQEWAAVLGQLDISGAVRALASHCALLGRSGAVVQLALDPRSRSLRTRTLEDKLAQALSRHYGENIRLEISEEAPADTPAQAESRAQQAQIEAARTAFGADPTVRALQERFGATLLPDTIRPAK
ncbi:MAG TPA: DNA polymerase III subunit gamma/tau [Steroidobacteraceae bacterium]|nr:DNA polymerase III subunit gamma/tau [Steroidobacteraceae bacterium]